MQAVAEASGHASRCLRIGEISWDTPPAAAGRDLCPSPWTRYREFCQRGFHIDGQRSYEALRASLRKRRSDFLRTRGETVAIVGESGCGKSTFARILMGLIQATSGSIKFADLELGQLPATRRNKTTIRSLQMIFQNPFETLNPSHSIGAQLSRAIRKLGVQRNEAQIRERMFSLLDLVKLTRDFAERRPRQLSGGQKQRVGVARAFAGNPALVVADEPVSALDVSVQAAVAELLIDIQRREGTTLVFISHDLSVVRYLADRIVVMYLGQIMEQGRTAEVFEPPYHPYTEALLAAIPIADRRYTKRKVLLSGEIPSASNPPPGCRFSTRCPHRIPGTCDVVLPPVKEFAPDHRIACHLPREHLLAMRPIFEVAAS